MKKLKNKMKKKIFMRYFNAFVALVLVFIMSGLSSFAAEKVYFYHADAAGTPVAMTDASGAKVWETDYKPFGEEQSVTASTDNNKKFIGKEKDEETGLYYFGARYMDAGIGRFTQTDPVGITEFDLMNPQRFNRYAYSLNNPYSYVDPDGRWILPLIVLGAAIYGILSSPTIAETPVSATDVHQDTSDLDLVINTATAVTISYTAISDGLVAAGEEVIGEVTGIQPTIKKPYKRPSGATTKAQRESVQGKPCVDCGKVTPKNVADHKKPLVEEYYEKGYIDKSKMHAPESVQPQCPTCSAKQGAKLKNYSIEMKKKHGL